ncbi:MAG: hypothetical protein HKN78_01550 [Sphingomonadaceae bacterium]|nr:hypothetical protein [Sphingomonadaceae bacterium]
MRNRVLSGFLLVCAAAAPVAAQDSESTRPPPSAPVFSLPPGNPVNPEPEPDVQGPRVPGESAPRRIVEDRPQTTPPPATANQPQPTAPVNARNAEAPARQTADRAAPVPVGTQTRSAQQAGPAAGASNAPETPEPAAGQSVAAPIPQADDPVAPATISPGNEAAAEEAGGALSSWWALVPALLLVALAAFLGFRRRARRDAAMTEESVVEPKIGEAEPVPPKLAMPTHRLTPTPATSEPPQPIVPARPATPSLHTAPADTAARPGRIEINLVPLNARLTPEGLAIDYRLHIANVGKDPLSDIAVALTIRAADRLTGHVPMQQPDPIFTLDRLDPGKIVEQDGKMRLPLQTIKPVIINGRPVCVPVVDMMPRYSDAAGNVHERHATILVGSEHNPPTAKVAPFALDKPEAEYRRVGCRLLQIPEKAAAAA